VRKLAITALTMAFLAGTGVALASTTTFPKVTVTPTVSPSKAGTKKHPRGVKLTTVFKWQNLGPAKQPIVTKFFLWFPKGSQYNGAKYKSCSRKKIARGPGACPKKSIMGSGTGTAYASTTKTHPKITVVNGGKSTIYFYTVLNNPARVRQAVVGKLKKLSGKFAYELTVTVPIDLRVVAGTPIALTYLKVVAGGKKFAPKWLATTGCDHGQWPFKVTTDYAKPSNPQRTVGSATYSKSIKCTG
jgi:hypothetical protein